MAKLTNDLLERLENDDPAALLRSLRGNGQVCGCGKLLTPLHNAEGKRIGVTHETIEDEDYHIWYFTGRGYNPETNEYEEGFNPYEMHQAK